MVIKWILSYNKANRTGEEFIIKLLMNCERVLEREEVDQNRTG